MKKFILIFLMVPVLLFAFNVQAVSAADNSVLIIQLEQEIQNLMKQIIALLQQQAGLQKTNIVQNNAQINSSTATLTVNASGVTAYVSINNGQQFTYTSPITLNNGDSYSVTASSTSGGSSTSKCSGIASSGGSYTCNVNMNSY